LTEKYPAHIFDSPGKMRIARLTFTPGISQSRIIIPTEENEVNEEITGSFLFFTFIAHCRFPNESVSSSNYETSIP
jgi:hypothetical protein